jgi:hypothetical protein
LLTTLIPPTSEKNDLVLVSGASGFIAAHLTSHLLMNDYRVRGTVRSKDKGEYLKKLYDGVGEFEYVIVEDIAEVSVGGMRLGLSRRSQIRFAEIETSGVADSPALSTKPSRGSMESVSLASCLITYASHTNVNPLRRTAHTASP